MKRLVHKNDFKLNPRLVRQLNFDVEYSMLRSMRQKQERWQFLFSVVKIQAWWRGTLTRRAIGPLLIHRFQALIVVKINAVPRIRRWVA